MKPEVYRACEKILAERISSLKQQLNELVEGAKNDSKSTAGDKHETARAMMQIEQEKLSNQLNLLLSQQQILNRIDPNSTSEIVVSGSLVKTNRGWIYISIPLGKIEVKREIVVCLSPQSPLGQKLVGRKTSESVTVNNSEFILLAIM